MGVISNISGDITVSDLRSALAYAGSELGIDVSTSSASEILNALSQYFPEGNLDIFDNGVYDSELTGGWYTAKSSRGNASVGSTLYCYGSSAGTTSSDYNSWGLITTNNPIVIPYAATTFHVRVGSVTHDGSARWNRYCFGLANSSQRTVLPTDSSMAQTALVQIGRFDTSGTQITSQTDFTYDITSYRGQEFYPKVAYDNHDPSFSGSGQIQILKMWFTAD